MFIVRILQLKRQKGERNPKKIGIIGSKRGAWYIFKVHISSQEYSTLDYTRKHPTILLQPNIPFEWNKSNCHKNSLFFSAGRTWQKFLHHFPTSLKKREMLPKSLQGGKIKSCSRQSVQLFNIVSSSFNSQKYIDKTIRYHYSGGHFSLRQALKT